MALAVLREREPDLDALRRAAEATRPVTLAGDRSLPVLEALEPLLPAGIRRGATVTVQGSAGSTALALALTAAASAAGAWVGIVAARPVGLAAAIELGIAPERLLVVPDPPAQSTATVVAALLDTVDAVCAGGAISAPDARRLLARARERETVLVPLGRWPLAADVRLSVTAPTWVGLAGGGAGRLVARRVDVTASGKGVHARERRTTLWLPDETGAVRCEA